ncbi:hypothetical protein INP77_02080 [Methylophilus sp. 13]|uniref:hypothetical protein n=1 Tax=Methylophilus sp. 13 TaxID=2781018 RepID=UPI00188EC5E7|nr:hypothetical protein [Methylophilus sp. 13]MBF5038271.1 hypothetical protein [Methylophilus sp. 13]
MSKSFYFLATDDDVITINNWLALYSPEMIISEKKELYCNGVHRQDVFHFSTMGPVITWEDSIDWKTYQSNRDKKSAIFASRLQKEEPKAPIVKLRETPCAVFEYPIFRKPNNWTCASLTFTPTNLNKTFPELNKIASEFGKWLRKNELVYSWDGKEMVMKYPNKTHGFSGYCIKVYMLPNAKKNLDQNALFFGEYVGEAKYNELIEKYAKSA